MQFPRKFILSCLFLLLFCGILPTKSFSANEELDSSIEQEQRNLKNLEADKQRLLEELKKTSGNESELKETLKFLANNRIELQKQLIQLEKNIQKLIIAVESNKKTIALLETKIDQRKEDLRKKLILLYRLMKIKEMSYLPSIPFLLNYRRNQFFLTSWANTDAEEFQKFNELIAQKTEQNLKLEEKEYELYELREEKKNAYDDLQFDEEQRKVYYEHLIREKKQNLSLLNKIDREFDYLNDKINRLRVEKTRKDRLDEEEEIFSQGFAKQRGKLPHPLNGTLEEGFGVGNSVSKKEQFKRGILIKPQKEENVAKAIFPGKVVFNGILKGYGKIIILDHGKSSFSIYGLIQESLVKKEDNILAGEPLGVVLQNSPGNDLFYFEMRYRNRPVDPNLWFKEPIR